MSFYFEDILYGLHLTSGSPVLSDTKFCMQAILIKKMNYVIRCASHVRHFLYFPTNLCFLLFLQLKAIKGMQRVFTAADIPGKNVYGVGGLDVSTVPNTGLTLLCFLASTTRYSYSHDQLDLKL